MQPICDMDGFIRVSPYAVIYVFRMVIASLVSLTGCTSYLSAKSILCISVYISGLIVLERKQTQSNIAKTLKLVTHDALNRLAEEIGGICHQAALELIYLLTAISNDGFIILDDVIIPKPFSKWVAGVYVDYDCTQKRHIPCLWWLYGPMGLSMSH